MAGDGEWATGGPGARFVVRLPRTGYREGQIMNVLVIEDNPDTIANLREVLAFDGYGLIAARTARDAIAHADWSQVGAMIIDSPSANGEEEPFLPNVSGAGPTAPVVVVTGHTDLLAALTALENRASATPLRPINPSAVRQNLARLAGLRTAEGQFAKASQMATIGDIAASVAHELHDAFGTMTLRLEAMLNRTPSDDPNRVSLEVVDQELERMAALVANLLEFAGPGRGQPSTVNVGEEVDRALSLIAYRLARAGIRVTPQVADRTPDIHADPHQLRQVLLNLLTNAADAMPDGGHLTVRVNPTVAPGGQRGITIEIADTGVGISPEALPHMTEAFFTTKDEGKGCGLGLNSSRRIIEDHGGTLSIQSSSGAGTTIHVFLPVCAPSRHAHLAPGSARGIPVASAPVMTASPTI